MYSTVHQLSGSCPVYQRFSIFHDWHAAFDTSRFPYRILSISIQIYPCTMKPWLFTIYKSFRKIRLVNGTRLFGSWVPAEKLREQPNIAKGSPIFADGMLQTEIRVPFLIPVPGFRGRFSVDGTDLCKRKTRFRKEISSPEFCLAFTQTVNRPVFQCKWWQP